MTEDLAGEIAAELARALRSIDVACTIANSLQEGSAARARALKIRRALIGVGIKFPPERPVPLEPEKLGLPWTYTKLARLAGAHRSTITRGAARLGITKTGAVTLEEARRILRALGMEAIAEELAKGEYHIGPENRGV